MKWFSFIVIGFALVNHVSASSASCKHEFENEKALFTEADHQLAIVRIDAYRKSLSNYLDYAPLKKVYERLLAQPLGPCMSDKQEYLLQLDAVFAEINKGLAEPKLQREARAALSQLRNENANVRIVKSWTNWKRPHR